MLCHAVDFSESAVSCLSGVPGRDCTFVTFEEMDCTHAENSDCPVKSVTEDTCLGGEESSFVPLSLLRPLRWLTAGAGDGCEPCSRAKRSLHPSRSYFWVGSSDLNGARSSMPQEISGREALVVR